MALRLLPIRTFGKLKHPCIQLRHLKTNERKKLEVNKNLLFLKDPDTFGTLSGRLPPTNDLEDKGDQLEESRQEKVPLKHQQLTIKQYSDLIKQYLKYKRLAEAINVLEVRMLVEDRVQPENYIYNILIGACAEMGYTKKAFKLFNDMKRRGLKPTGDTYTCLFHACYNSPWLADGLKNATHLRNLMLEKNIEPNVTIYNSMIKAFGRCGDLTMAFKIVDEMVFKKIKIRVHTFNHLLQACITDKEKGLKLALLVWRKMLVMREKPNIYSFNLMLKCVKDCNLGSNEDVVDLISCIQQQYYMSSVKDPSNDDKTFVTFEPKKELCSNHKENKTVEDSNKNLQQIPHAQEINICTFDDSNTALINKSENVKHNATFPNLLARNINFDGVFALQKVNSNQEKFAIIGGQEGFLKEMNLYSVKPDIKTFTQILFLTEEDTESENKLIESMRAYDVLIDIDFYNMLIKKRCYRKQYDSAFDVMQLIEMEIKHRKKRYHPLSKKRIIKPNIMTYGVLALACTTRNSAEKLLNTLKEKQIKVNIEILGSLLRQATVNNDFEYVQHIMKITQEENVHVSDIFLKHLQNFNDKCTNLIKKGCNDNFSEAYNNFNSYYSKWLREINLDEALSPENPWQQFKETYPETFQHQNITIKEPKRYYKPKRYPRPYSIKM